MSIQLHILNKHHAQSLAMITKAHYLDPKISNERFLTKNLFRYFVEDIDHNLSVLIVDWLWLQ